MDVTSAPSATNDASQLALLKSLKARVVTTAIGFRIGPLGVDYSSKRVEIDPEEASTNQEGQSGSRQAFEQALARGEAAGTAARLEDATAKANSHPDPAWRRGLAAYAKASAQGLYGCVEMRSVLAVA